MRIGMEGADGVGLEDGFAICTGDAKSFVDIAIGLLEVQRSCAAACGDALTKLPKLVALKLNFQFGLTRKDDLQEFLARRFEIQEEPDFLERGGLQTLRLVDDQDGDLSGAVALKEPAIEGHQLFAF